MAFGRAEAAVPRRLGSGPAAAILRQRATIIMALKPADVRRIWGEVFTHYRNLSSYPSLLGGEGIPIRVSTACAKSPALGRLAGTEARGGTRITLGNWFHEVHYLVHEDGAWLLGNARAPRRARLRCIRPPSSPLFHNCERMLKQSATARRSRLESILNEPIGTQSCAALGRAGEASPPVLSSAAGPCWTDCLSILTPFPLMAKRRADYRVLRARIVSPHLPRSRGGFPSHRCWSRIGPIGSAELGRFGGERLERFRQGF